jgi:hypothetical protein
MKHLNKIVAVVGSALAMPFAVLAQTYPFQRAQQMAGEVGGAANINSTKSLSQIVGSIINVALGFLGIVFLVLLLYAGFLWMTAAGDETKTKKAKDIIMQSIIGLVIVVAAFAISNFVLGSLLNVTQ